MRIEIITRFRNIIELGIENENSINIHLILPQGLGVCGNTDLCVER